jgi:hypothetical protein
MNFHERLSAIDADAAIKHLRELDADGVHQLAAINSDTGLKRFCTFRLNAVGEKRACAFVLEHGPQANLYYAINEVREDLGDVRASKADVTHIRMVGADLDADARLRQTPEVMAAEYKRLDRIRRDAEIDDDEFCSFAVRTGGGIQLGWKLRAKLLGAEWRDAAEDQGRGVLRRLGAEESTADITRLFRLPGTLNFPNASKRKRGRTEITAASAIEYISDSATTLDDMAVWAPPVSAPKPKASSTSEADLDYDAVQDVQAAGILPDEVAAKFARARTEDSALDRLWEGEKLVGADQSGSAFTLALAVRVRRTGLFTLTEFGQLLAVWEHRSDNFDARQIARAWGNSGAAAATEEFEAAEVSKEPSPIPLQCFRPFDVADLPKRQWLVGKYVAANYLASLIAPSGIGKTTYLLTLALAAVTGRSDILGMKIHKRVRVFLWNQEDEADELRRRLFAIMQGHGIEWADLMVDGKDGIIFGSGADYPLLMARKSGDVVLRSQDAGRIESLIRDEGIGIAIFDPLVELHNANENDNGEMAAVAQVFRRIAVKCQCGVIVAHHTRKPPNAANRESLAGDPDAGRGAGSPGGVARMVATLYTLDAVAGKRYGITAADCGRYVRFDDGKANMSLKSEEPTLFRREGVLLGGLGGEEVGILRLTRLTKAKSAAETKEEEDAAMRDEIRGLLRSARSHSLSVASVTQTLIEKQVVQLVAPEALRKRVTTMFKEDLAYDNGDVVSASKGSIKGQPGRHTILTAEFAEIAEGSSASLPQEYEK